MTSIKDMFLRGIAVLGLIAILLLGAWGIIQIAVKLPSFFSWVGSSVASMFDRDEEENAAVVPAPAATSTPSTTTKPSKPVVSNPKPGTTYVSSGARSNLYGTPDLSARILSVSPQGSRVNVSFEIGNYGTNVASKNWSFVAVLPMMGGYPYYSAGQQALYPGDRIVYTMSFDANSYGYNDNDDCEWDNRDREWDCDDRNDRRSNGVFTVTADFYNQIRESNEVNNSVSWSL